MAAHGHTTLTLDNSPEFQPDVCKSIFDVIELPVVDILWASPPCQGFSVAVIGRNWNYDNTPKTESARIAMEVVQKTLELIKESHPTSWFIENPRGKLRKMPFMQGLIRHTVTYCQYGDTRMKPTDIWTNATWWKPRAICKNGDKCHESAPRGSRTGTQGLDSAMARGVIPRQLFEEILSQMP